MSTCGASSRCEGPGALARRSRPRRRRGLGIGVYAIRHPSCGAVNVDQPLELAPFVGLVQSLADKLRGPAFPAVWDVFVSSMHVDPLPAAAQELVRPTCRPRQDLVLAYWREVLERTRASSPTSSPPGSRRFGRPGVRYLVIAGAHLDADYQDWLSEVLPEADVTVWPGSGHFPHLADPDRFAQCLAATTQWAKP